MEVFAVITGDIKNFTKLDDNKRKHLVEQTVEIMRSMVRSNRDASMFRGDSFQLKMKDVPDVLKGALQLICWFKLNAETGKNPKLGSKISVGIGSIAYEGETVLDSDGEAFHFSGRGFDMLENGELIRLTTNDEYRNNIYKVVLMYINRIAEEWTISQAKVIYQTLKMQYATQEELAQQLGMSQPNVAKNLRAAHWAEVETGINYINNELKLQYLI